jgi:serine/threonine-protein kinase
MNQTPPNATGPWREALACLDEVLSRPEESRGAYLTELAKTRPDLHERVRALLEADALATRQGFLAEGAATPRAASALREGLRLGPYRMVRELGEGGMGEVWLARRDDGIYQGEVAIKTLHPYFAHGAMRDRFLREAQMLGKLTHPHIARMLDAGVSEGVVYLVLEYVHGEHIDAYCDAHTLGVDARLKLFAAVCAAVAHAHANLIVHRDIKPTNILVTADGRVKLLDFGIGKLVEGEAGGAVATELTRVTGRVFTPEYAAPEQVLGEPVTTATDVYSLGVLLYTLLAGARPYAQDTNVAVKIEHAVLHEEPRSLGEAARKAGDEVAARRATTPAKLQRMLSGDLENIVQRALRKAPAERYRSVLALSEDLERHARHEPVLARAGSRGYRLGRFVRRHRLGVAATAGVVLAALVGVAGVLYQAQQAREQARLARIESAKATTTKEFLLKIFEANGLRHPEGAQAKLTTAQELLGIASQEIIKDTALEPDVRVELMATLSQLNMQVENYEVTQALNAERARFVAEKFGSGDARIAETWLYESESLRMQGKADEGIAQVERAIKMLDAQGDRSSTTRGYAEVQLGNLQYEGWDGSGEGPIVQFRKGIAILEKHPPGYQLVAGHLGLGRSLEYANRLDEAVLASERGIALGIQVDGERSINVAGGHQQLAHSLQLLYRIPEAEEHMRKSVEIFRFLGGPENQYTTSAQLEVGRLLSLRGQYLAAAKELESALAIRERINGPDDYWVQQMRTALVSAQTASGDLDRAGKLIDAVAVVLEKGGSKRYRASVARLKAAIEVESGRAAAALPLLDRSATLLAESPPPHALPRALLLTTRIEALAALGRSAEARAAIAEATDLLAEADTKDPDKAATLTLQSAALAVDLADQKPQAARESALKILASLAASRRRADLWVLESQTQKRLAQAELALGHRQEALAAATSALELRERNALPTDPRLAALRELKRRCA